MPSRKARKRYRQRAEATAAGKCPNNAPPEREIAGDLGDVVQRESESSLFQSNREFYEDSLLLRRALREGWDVPESTKKTTLRALFRVLTLEEPDAVAAGIEGPGQYRWATRRRLAVGRLLLAIDAEDRRLERTAREAESPSLIELVRAAEERRNAAAVRLSDPPMQNKEQG